MKRHLLGVVVALAVCVTATGAQAALVQFLLNGNAGFGLLPGNENPASGGPGTGGMGPGGIVFNSNTNMLSIDVLWGSGNGFQDLSGNATTMHIHGPTASPAPQSFLENAGVLITLHTLGGFNSSASNGGLQGTVSVAGNVNDLLVGRLYINVHSGAFGSGEIRGQLVKAIPEPTSIGLLGAGILGVVFLRRRRRQ